MAARTDTRDFEHLAVVHSSALRLQHSLDKKQTLMTNESRFNTYVVYSPRKAANGKLD
jgi:hypothetical protein